MRIKKQTKNCVIAEIRHAYNGNCSLLRNVEEIMIDNKKSSSEIF